MNRKLVAAIACRNMSSRLYAKPLHYLDIKNKITVLDFIISRLKKQKSINEIVLGISNKTENKIYIDIAKKFKIKYILGDDHNVLSRLIKCGKLSKATDIFRITSESPFTFLDNLNHTWTSHQKLKYDASFLDDVIDGCGYEIINLKSLIISNKKGSGLDRGELCTRYIRKNKTKFKIKYIKAPKYLKSKKYRLTIDYPEDLILCRKVYKLVSLNNINFKKITKFISQKNNKELISKFVKSGYKNMYL